MLDDGTQIGAAHTPEARREGVTLSEGDRRRYVDTPSPRLLVVESPRSAEDARADVAEAPVRAAQTTKSDPHR